MNDPARPVPDLNPAATCPAHGGAEGVAIFRDYPRLKERLPHVSLGCFPTPVERLVTLGASIGLDNLYIKRDDLSGGVYGGNKVRKLEFLLGDALHAGTREVITLGFAGSNHALATAIYARRLGLASTSMLLPQANAHYVRRNLLASFHHKAELRHYATMTRLRLGFCLKFLESLVKRGAFPRMIPAGGSCPRGVIGYVSAALELKAQILAGELPAPDCIYVPAGSMGTSVGLVLGLKAAGLKSRVVAVRVIDRQFANAKKMVRLFRQTVCLLRELDPTFPAVGISENELEVRDDCFGDGYARFSERAMEAAALMKEKAGIILNGTYSAKGFAAVVGDARARVLTGRAVLYWNTYNSRDLSAFTRIDYHRLPTALHRYFEEDVQPLDKGLDR